jgi:hypothetical protein
MNPGGSGKIERIRGTVARTPLDRVQGFQVSLETEFSGAAGQSDPFQRGLEKIAAIQVAVLGAVAAAVGSLLSNERARGDSDRREASSHVGRKTIAKRIVDRRTNGFGRLLLELVVMNLTLALHLTVIAVVVILIKQRRRGIKMIAHNSKQDTDQIEHYCSFGFRL